MGLAAKHVSTVTFWYRKRHFQSDDEARGAFLLAYQQGLDGMGNSIPEWMGLTSEEYDAWVRRHELPPKSKRPKKKA